MLIDEVKIHVRGGQGGHGCMSFRRERYIPKGGPDGGNGGTGGSVYLEVDPSLDTLGELAGKHHWAGENGRGGGSKNCHGRCGQSTVVPVPPGTLVYDLNTGIRLKDLTEPGERACVALGGAAGMGNKSFATATDRAPRTFTKGEKGQERRLRLELKLLADVGIVGLPNAGKSTLLARLSAARPKIADYPFTTLHPSLGIVELSGYRRIVMADIPGLIEGAHRGSGLGDAFLKHIERTRIILHLVDIAPPASAPAPVEAYRMIRRELERYSPALADKPELLVVNKIDLTVDAKPLAELREATSADILAISAVAGTGLPEMIERVWTAVTEAPKPEPAPDGPVEPL